MNLKDLGKTHLCGTLCDIVPATIVTGDLTGFETLTTMNNQRPFRYQPYIIFIESWLKADDYVSEIEKRSETDLALVLDDFGSIQDRSYNKASRMPRRWEERQPDIAKTIEKQLLLGERKLEYDQWGQITMACETFLNRVMPLPFKLRLVTIREKIDSDKRTGEDKLYPALRGDLRTGISARFSLVAESFLATVDKKQVFCLSSRSHPHVETKDRFTPDGAGRTWLNPDMAKVIAHINRKEEVAESATEIKIGSGIPLE